MASKRRRRALDRRHAERSRRLRRFDERLFDTPSARAKEGPGPQSSTSPPEEPTE